ncbi:SRPBCC family protein [Ancylomarina salipaludis]|uniref:SRPBCC family protein n=1 Tax=Ancylomarina salipaludis TaxID=2501299 RepID=A0A4Q1JN67_9BACT|nr:SRPBCC family protein [Ancylomarina salipaludis]RXQ95555.1 SRPBCC family protein [Ancylomarina salipaludis]
MKNTISKFCLIVLLLVGISASAFSQMKPAKMLPPKVKRIVTIKAPANEVWKLIASLEKVEEYAPAIVKSSSADGQGRDAVREMKMVDGSDRLETVLIFDPDNKHICFIPFDEYMPAEYVAVHIYVTAQGPNKCKVSYRGYLNVKEGQSEGKLIRQLGSEFTQTLNGLKAYMEAQ